MGGSGEQHIELARRRLDRSIAKAKQELSKLEGAAANRKP